MDNYPKVISAVVILFIALCFMIYAIYYFVLSIRYESAKGICTQVMYPKKNDINAGKVGTFSFIVDNRRQLRRQKNNIIQQTLIINKTYSIYVNPKDPEKFFTRYQLNLSIVLFLVGIFLVVLVGILI